jgi:biotin carboxyl carrier protein
VSRDGGRFRVSIRDLDDVQPPRVHVVDSRATDLGLSLAFEDGRIADAAVTARPNGEYLIQLPGVDVPVVVDGRRRRQGQAAGAGKGEQRITAPMPGRVLRLLVRPGDEVTARQGLVVVEAMKMENELRAGRAGRVREVVVMEGISVEAGRLLVIIE